MASCRTVGDQLTAWIDGELSAGEDERVRTHLDGCASCVAEAKSLRAAIELQRPALARLAAVPDLDVSGISRRFRQTLAALPDEATGSWGHWRQWLLRPVAIAGAAMAAGVAALVLFAGGPEAVLVPLGVEPPPVAVSRQPDLFKDYTLIQHLDALENFDTVESTPLDDDQAPQRG